MLIALAVAAGSYLIGSIPFSFLIARAFGVSDVRRVGSGNVGATNVLRTAGRSAGVLAFLLDAAKGAMAPALAAFAFPHAPMLSALAAVGVVVGHMYPVWLRFQGGKGVATGLGAFAPLAPPAAAASVLVFVLVIVTTRFVSLGSIAGAIALVTLAFVGQGCGALALAAALVAGLIVFRHRTNLRRIMVGTERRIGQPRG